MPLDPNNTKDRLLVQIASYNTNLQGQEGVPQDLVDWLSPTLQVSTFLASNPRAPDIIAVGFQELLPLHLGLLGLSKSVIEHRDDLILSQIEKHAPNKERYVLVAKVVNVGVALLVYARDDTVGRKVTDVETSWTGCGPLYMGNKGAVGVRFRVQAEEGPDEIYTFVCAHLTAQENKNARRLDDYHYISSSLLFRPLPNSPSSPTKTASTIFETSHLFFLGDLNFRLELPKSHPHRVAHQKGEFAHVLDDHGERERLTEFDQLLQARKRGSAFVGLREGEFWQFKCSYKYHHGEVDKYSAKRLPSWTDRILYTTYTDSPDKPEESNITNLLYTTIPSYTSSDHKPIVALLMLPSPPASPPAGIPTLQLPAGATSMPDPHANLKRYTGRVLDRLAGLVLYILTIVGLGSPYLGLGNCVLGLSVWSWWMSR